MTRYVALLRAVNVGGTGRLAMPHLAGMCTDAGFEDVRTYIASGNVVFSSGLPPENVKAALETRLADYAGKPVGVFVRDADEIAGVLAGNPFADKDPKFTATIFLDAAPPPDALDGATGQDSEIMALGTREIYVHYPDGMGRSKLKIPAAKAGTARNMNTVAKLAEMAAGA
ncbi:MAG: DUF1697 domain-containing protein [Rhodobiaceae bacterium]|nr:DUF1697 domain-containing protein [Rhodobiaceae bacterium]MCC0014502.1 DUF1697 domain-containing protein [Rhodobiaceae bacterium]MCC0050646.1 DUF1697 domain-containing protein [Rhodobiaceae bacterium]MCC0059849.1 DUF1697 domain-containing protein [Rhodobiaceae bacterium]